MTVGTKRESFVQMDIGHWYQSSTASNRIWHVIYCWIYLWNLLEAEVFVLQKEKTQQVPNKLSWYVKHLPKFGNHSHFWRRCMNVGYLSWTWTFLLNTICEFERGWRHSFSMIPNAKNCDYTKHGSSANRKHHADSHIYVVILYAITGIFCMWTAILLLRTHIFSFIHRRILAHFRTSIPLTVCNSISNRSVLVVVNFVFRLFRFWFIRACCAIPSNEIPRNGTLELVLLFRIIFRTLIITGTVLRNVLEHEKLFLSHPSSAPIFIWFSLLLKCFAWLLRVFLLSRAIIQFGLIES